MFSEAFASEYSACLCHMRDGDLAPYDAVQFIAGDENAAIRQAMSWAMYAVDFLNERTWLAITLGDATIFCNVLGSGHNANASEEQRNIAADSGHVQSVNSSPSFAPNASNY
jgi:hypothetical protein